MVDLFPKSVAAWRPAGGSQLSAFSSQHGRAQGSRPSCNSSDELQGIAPQSGGAGTKEIGIRADKRPSLRANSPQRHRGHRGTQRATQRRPRRSPTRFAGSAEDLPIALDAGRPIEAQAFSTRASPAWANQSDALKVRLKWHAPKPGCTRSVLGLKERRATRTGSWSSFLFETIADEVRVPGGTDDPAGTLLCVPLCPLCLCVNRLLEDPGSLFRSCLGGSC